MLIGLDAGTSALKAVLFSRDGRVIASSRYSYPMLHPAPGYAEQYAADWWTALVAAVRELIRDIDPLQVCAIGLSTQGGTLQAVNTESQALHPAISWMDTRASQQNAIFRECIGSERMREITGWSLC
ncbi:MAG: xylulokinase, partial [Firmicutes bacterium]|nr:xylulokinase [Bacillota bacterium]